MDEKFPFDHYLKDIGNRPSLNLVPQEVSVPNDGPKKKEEEKAIDSAVLNPFQKFIQTAQSASLEKDTVSNGNKFSIDLNETQEDLLSKVEGRYINHMNEDRHLLIDPKKTFENFVVGPFNQMTSATASAVADHPGKGGPFPCLYIHGGSGLGKTHLLHAVANKVRDKYPDMAVCLITAMEFVREMINAIHLNKISDFQKKYSETVNLLMIDDIHELKGKQRTQNEFFHIFNELHQKGKQLIFTSDKAPREIDGIEERIKTRLQWGLVMNLQRPDFETRVAILKKKAYDIDLFLNEEAFSLIADNITSNIRELEGSLIKLCAFKDIMKVELDTEIIKNVLTFGESNRPSANITTMEGVAKAVAKHFQVPFADVKSKSRTQKVVRARHLAIYLSKKRLPSLTLKDLADFYRKDHSSVIYSITKVSKEIKTRSELAREVLSLERSLSGS